MIITIVQQIASAMGLEFYHGRSDFQNLVADEGIFPAIYLDQPIDTNYNLSQSGYTSASYPLSLLFLYKSELDLTPEQHDTNCIQPAETQIRSFLNRCQNHASIDLIDSITGTEVINLFDVNVSGKILNVTIQINNEFSVCS